MASTSPPYSTVHSPVESSSQTYQQSYSDRPSSSTSQTYYSESNSLYAPHQHRQLHSSGDAPLPSSITSIANSFPLALSLPLPESSSLTHFETQTITLRTLTTHYLPIYSEALRLVRIYLEQAPWFFGAVTQRQIEEEILPLWYEEAAALATSPPQQQKQASSSPGAQSPTDNSSSRNTSLSPSITTTSIGTSGQIRVGNSHDLAILFMLFCFGSLTDVNLPSPPDNIPAERFYQLTKASLTLDPQAGAGEFCNINFISFFNIPPTPDAKSFRNGVFERPPSVTTVQALSLMAIYEGICSGENSIESTWALMGLACKLAQSVSFFLSLLV